MFRAVGAEGMARGAHVRVKITGTDLLTLDLHASVVARLDDAAAVPAANPDIDAEADELAENAGPLTLAIDVPPEGEATEPATDTAS